MGNLSSEIGEVVLQDVFVPRRRLPGRRTRRVQEGHEDAQHRPGRRIGRRDRGRAGGSRRAVEYAKERSAFGKTIGSYQGVSFPLAKAKAEIEAARLAM